MAARVNNLFADLWTSRGDSSLVLDSLNNTPMPTLLGLLSDADVSKIALVGPPGNGKSEAQAFLAALSGTIVNVGAIDGPCPESIESIEAITDCLPGRSLDALPGTLLLRSQDSVVARGASPPPPPPKKIHGRHHGCTGVPPTLPGSAFAHPRCATMQVWCDHVVPNAGKVVLMSAAKEARVPAGWAIVTVNRPFRTPVSLTAVINHGRGDPVRARDRRRIEAFKAYACEMIAWPAAVADADSDAPED